MKRTIRKSYYGNFRKRYPKLKRAIMIQRAFVATSRHFWHKVAPKKFERWEGALNPLMSIAQSFTMRRIYGLKINKTGQPEVTLEIEPAEVDLPPGCTLIIGDHEVQNKTELMKA